MKWLHRWVILVVTVTTLAVFFLLLPVLFSSGEVHLTINPRYANIGWPAFVVLFGFVLFGLCFAPRGRAAPSHLRIILFMAGLSSVALGILMLCLKLQQMDRRTFVYAASYRQVLAGFCLALMIQLVVSKDFLELVSTKKS